MPNPGFRLPRLQEQQAAWVVTGGLGALGALTADWLVGQGQRHLVLLGRSGR